MLTRLRVQGFKNLVDAQVLFGPFTCIAGANAVGKSNLFDAISFLRDLTYFPIVEAAARVRDPVGKASDVTTLFTKTRKGPVNRMSFDCDIIVPSKVLDDFGRTCTPSITLLNYQVSFTLDHGDRLSGAKLVLEKEELTYIQKREAVRRLGFNHSLKFRNSVVFGRRTTPLISTESAKDQTVIKLHQDGGSSGPAFRVPARSSPRTLMGGVNTNDQPTVLAARREMQSWMLLQLEPSSLRRPDDFSAAPHITQSGEHLPSTLIRLGTDATVAGELSELLPDVKEVYVDQDEGRRLRTLMIRARDGLEHAARSLSDGTLRFLALAVLGTDPEAGRLICLEEPENGIHPSRVGAMLTLLQNIAVDPKEEVDDSNAFRQVIINTHSPLVVQSLPEDCLVIARSAADPHGQQTTFSALSNTWRTKSDSSFKMPSADLGEILSYLGDARAWMERQRAYKRSVLDYVQAQQLQLGLDTSDN